jgi:hypothetical protein
VAPALLREKTSDIVSVHEKMIFTDWKSVHRESRAIEVSWVASKPGQRKLNRRNKQCIYIYLNFFGWKQVDNNQNQLFSPKNNRNCHARPRPSVKTRRIRRFWRIFGVPGSATGFFHSSGLNMIDIECNHHLSPKTDRTLHARPRPSVKTWRIQRFWRIFGVPGSATGFFSQFWAKYDRYWV